MKKRVILILCVLAVLLTAVICLPFARKIDTTVTATEYRFNDPAYAVEHTVMICGHDTRNLLGYGVFEGTFAVSGFESGQEGWTFRVSFSDKKSLGTAFSRRPSGETCTRDLFHLRGCSWRSPTRQTIPQLEPSTLTRDGFWSAVPPTERPLSPKRRRCSERTPIGRRVSKTNRLT